MQALASRSNPEEQATELWMTFRQESLMMMYSWELIYKSGLVYILKSVKFWARTELWSTLKQV